MSNQTLSDGESMMAWLELRVDQTDNPNTIRAHQQNFVEMWKQEFGNTQDIPQDFKDKVEQKWWSAMNNPKWE